MEIEDTPELVRPVVIAAFEGWNDAAEAASAVVDHLMQVWDARVTDGPTGRVIALFRCTQLLLYPS